MKLHWFIIAATLLTSAWGDQLTLPDGTEFKCWEVPLQFTRTYHVAQQVTNASDDNPGTAQQPFRTIQRAANVLQPGERVVIHAGTYRECVRPPRGGTSPAEMISYEAAPGEAPVITGAEVFHGVWIPSNYFPNDRAREFTVWTTRLPREWFRGENPFRELLGSQFSILRFITKRAESARIPPPLALYRGLVIQDGRRWEQVESAAAVIAHPQGGVFWVEEDGLTLHARAFRDVNPNGLTLEMTARSQCFAPDERHLGYIRVQGLAFQYAGNGILPHRGMLAVASGHHWLIESNTVRSANGVGIDIGRENWDNRPITAFGNNIVRGNIIIDCGSNGIVGLGRGSDRQFVCLVEDNVLRSNCWQDTESVYENAAIKLHLTTDTVIRHNLISDTFHGPAIWLDNGNSNTVCRGNVILNTTTRFGAIMIELSDAPNLVVSNVIWQCSGAGFYEHDSKDQIVRDNFIAHTTGPGIFLHGKVSPRPQHGVGHHIVTGNVLFATKEPIKAVAPDNTISGNITQGVTATLDAAAGQLTWQAPGHPGQIIDFHALTAESK